MNNVAKEYVFNQLLPIRTINFDANFKGHLKKKTMKFIHLNFSSFSVSAACSWEQAGQPVGHCLALIPPASFTSVSSDSWGVSIKVNNVVNSSNPLKIEKESKYETKIGLYFYKIPNKKFFSRNGYWYLYFWNKILFFLLSPSIHVFNPQFFLFYLFDKCV